MSTIPNHITDVGNSLIWNYYADCCLLTEIDKFGRALTEGSNKTFQNFIKFLHLATSVYPELSYIPREFMDRGSLMYYPRLGNKKYYVDEMLQELQRREHTDGIALVRKLIFEHLTQRIIQIGYDEGRTIYERFKINVLNKIHPARASVISFNFDTLLCEQYPTPISFDYVLDFDRNYRREPYKANRTYSLLKLHGSLDWGISQNDTITLHPTYIRAFEDYGSDGEPLILMPHENRHSILEPVWEQARQDISKAHTLTVIGYSFPTYDTPVKNLFNDNLPSVARIEVIDIADHPDGKPKREQEIRNHYAKIYPNHQGQIDIQLDGFNGYLEQFEDERKNC